MKITHPKGQHYSTPFQFGFWYKPQVIIWECEFGEDAKYIQPDEGEQWDWLKLCGVAFTLNAMHESVMVGWRYIPEGDKFQFCAYFHVAKGREYSEPLITLPGGGKVQCKIEIIYDDFPVYHVFLSSGVGSNQYSAFFFHKYKFAREVNAWFGGTLKAPKKVTFFKKRV